MVCQREHGHQHPFGDRVFVLVGVAEHATAREGCRIDPVGAGGHGLDEPQPPCVARVARRQPVADNSVRVPERVGQAARVGDPDDLGPGHAIDQAGRDVVSRPADEDDSEAHAPNLSGNSNASTGHCRRPHGQKPVRPGSDTASGVAEPTTLPRVEALLAFGAALLALRLAGALAARWRARRAPELAAWAASLAAYAVASAALAWGAAAGWSNEAFRVYYLFGGLLTATLLGLGSLLLVGVRWTVPLVLVYCGVAAGVAIAEPLQEPVGGSSIPDAQEHLDFFPARLLAVVGNSAGTIAVVGVAVATIRRRPLGNALVVAGVAVAAAGSALAGLGEAESAAFIAVAALLLYAGFVTRRRWGVFQRRAPDSSEPAQPT
jgi:hypothetical protein